MKISLDWLSDYVKTDIPVPDLLDRLAMIGLVVESAEEKDGDIVLDVETYANRPDTLGHLGIARETAVLLGIKLEERTWPLLELSEKTAELVDIQIVDETLCPRYCGILVKGVQVGPSPDWLKERIEAMGLRSINNVVDATNYVLYATAQPIHAFDFDKLAGGRVVVRKAMKGEQLKSLEGTVIDLSPDMLVIADEDKPVALAGVIGGEETAVTETTKDVFIESAYFDPVSIRLTSKKAGLSTDASYRFERGADIGFPPRAALMAAALLCQFDGKATTGVLDLYPKSRKSKSVVLRRRRIFELLGVDVPADFIRTTLEGLGFKIEENPNEIWRVEVPSFRVDVEREADLIEEVARFYGYDRIPSETTPIRSFEPNADRKRDRIRKLRQALLHQGFDEVINFSFSDPEKESAFGNGLDPIPLRNPISSKAATLRTSLLMGLLENLSWNIHRGLESVHIFEVGNIYFRKEEDHCEQLSLGLAATGLLGGVDWRAKREETSFFVLKGALEALLSTLRYEPFSFEEIDHPFFEKGRSLALVYKGETLGALGILRKGLRDLYSLESDVYAAEIHLSALLGKQPRPFAYASVPKFPGMSRDLSFLIDRGISYQEVRKAVSKLTVPHLTGFELTDRYSGPSIPKDKVSLSLRFLYRNPKKTLLAEDVDKSQQEIIDHLKAAFNIRLREGGQIDNRA